MPTTFIDDSSLAGVPPTSERLTVVAADHGRRMSLEDFERASTPDGVTIELSRGRIDLGEIPSRLHALSPSSIRRDYEERPAEYLALGVREY